MISGVAKPFEERPRRLERPFGHGGPEVAILGEVVVVRPRCVADDAEAEKGHTVDETRLGDGSGLHVDSHPLGEVALDGGQLGGVLHEAVARADESAVNAALQSGAVVQLQRVAQQLGRSLVVKGHTLHLAVAGAVVAAVDVVIDQPVAGHYIAHAQACVDTSRHAGADNAVRPMTADKFGGSHGGVHLADATLGKHDVVAAQEAFHVAETAFAALPLLRQAVRQLAVLAVHCTDDAYLHILIDA